MGFFKILEFAEEFVVVRIGNFRLGLGVVEVVVVVEELAKLGGAVLRRGKVGEEVWLGHGEWIVERVPSAK